MKKRFFPLAVAFLVGILVLLQTRSFQKVKFLVSRAEPKDVLQELRILQAANAELRDHIEEETAALGEINNKLAAAAAEEEVERLRALAGSDAVSGEGVEIIFSEAVPEFWISDLIAQFVHFGAEAVAINDIRLISQTAGFRRIGEGFLMRRYFLRAPFRVVAIGPRQEMEQSLHQRGGILDRMKNAHPSLKISVAAREKVVIPALPQ